MQEAAQAARVAETADPQFRRHLFHQEPCQRAGAGDDLRKHPRCPNRSECWTRLTATFMILGETCTRPCGFCAVKRGRPEAVALDQPCPGRGMRAYGVAPCGHHVSDLVTIFVTAARSTSGNACWRFAMRTGATIEVLTPDFDGCHDRIDLVLSAQPEVFNHNLETVARLQQHVRRKSQYEVSLDVLRHVKTSSPQRAPRADSCSALGETTEELIETLADLRSVGCSS